jgi:hypothetical protein
MINLPDADELTRYLGSPENDPSLINLLQRFGPEFALQKAPDLYTAHISHLEVGVNFAFQDEHMVFNTSESLGGTYLLMAIHFYADGYEGAKQYEGKLPNDMHFSDSRDMVRQKLRAPTKSGGGGRVGALRIPFWDLFSRERYSIHVSYSNDSSQCNLVTLKANLGQE